MIFNLYDKDGNYVNGITSSLEFVKDYCKQNGYTYVEEIRNTSQVSSVIEPEVDLQEAKIQAVSDRQDFLEDCIAEMAMQIYN